MKLAPAFHVLIPGKHDKVVLRGSTITSRIKTGPEKHATYVCENVAVVKLLAAVSLAPDDHR